MNIKLVKRWMPLVLIVLLIGSIWVSGLMDMVSLETIKEQRGQLLELVSTHPILSVLAFISIYIAAVALSIYIATVLTLLGGFLFGSVFGTIVIVIGASAGATILFLIARSALGNALQEKAGSLYDKVAKNMEENAVGYMMFMRLVPLFPFFLVNIVPALFNVRLMPYVITTVIGIIPGTFVYANVGRELGEIDSLSDLASPQTLIAFGLLGLFALIPTIYNQIKSRKKAVAVMAVVLLAGSNNAYAGESYDRFLSLYDGLLATHLSASEKGGVVYMGVDYDGWAKDKRHKQAMNLILSENPDSYKGEAKKAFWVNAYKISKLDEQLDEQVKLTLSNAGKGVSIENGSMRISKIFSWFSVDFNEGNVKGWLGANGMPIEGKSIGYLNYDWSLNKVNK